MAEVNEQLKQWQGRVLLACRYQEKHGDTDGRWSKNVKAMAGDFNSVAELGEEAIDVNLVYSTIKTLLPPLYVTDPFVCIRPTKPRTNDNGDNRRMAEVTELELNYWLRELNVKDRVRQVVHDGEATNHGYLYVGYIRNKQEADAEVSDDFQPQRPFVRRICPRNVLVPPGYDSLDDCPWVDIVFCRPLEYVKDKYDLDDNRARSLKTRKFEGARDDKYDSGLLNGYLETDDAQLVDVHNVWDRENKKVYVFAEGDDKWLEEPSDWPFKLEGFPLCHYRPNDVPDEYYGTPPISYYLPQNKELNSIRTAMRKRRNRTKAVVWADADVPDEMIEKYQNADDGEVIRGDLGDKNVRDAIMLDTGIPFDQGDLAYDAVMKSDVFQMSGLGTEQRGTGDPNVDSATASANIEKHAQIRASDRGDKVRSLYINVARKLWMILKQFPNVERHRLITGSTLGATRSVKYTLKELRGEFEFDMDFSAMMNDNPQTRATQAILNYNLLRGDPLVNHEQLILDVFRSQNKVQPENYMLFLRDPDEELRLMLMGLPVECHERDDHEQHLQRHDFHGAQLERAIQQAGPTSEMGEKARLAMALLVAHVQDHIRKIQQIEGLSSRPPGTPVAENLMRNQARAVSGGETAAELAGQSLSRAGMVG